MSKKQDLKIEFVDGEPITEEECESIAEMLMELFERELRKQKSMRQ